MQSTTVPWLALCFFASWLSAAESPPQVDTFAAQLTQVRSLPQTEQDEALRNLALDQAQRGNAVLALKALSYVSAPKELAKGIDEIRLLRHSGSNPGAPGKLGPDSGGRGGSSLADFTSLMDLIQTTVVPDTWEALGGPSTMSPYPAGILVDGDGVVQDAVVVDKDLLNNIDVMLKPDATAGANPADRVDAWRLAAPHRCVSLLRLSQEVLRRRIMGQPIDAGIRNLAGLSRIQYVVLDAQNRDVILVGPVGGIESRQGWMRDQKTGRVAMQLEYFTTAAASIFAGQPFGCTIDPTPESLAAAAKVTTQVQSGDIPIGLAAQHLRDAMGSQDVLVFGTAGDTPLGYMMVAADRHMKQLALGLQPLPPGAPNYLDVVTRHLAKGPPNGQLLRLWFTAQPMAVRVDQAGTVFELAGRPLKLASETTLAAQDGQRVPAAADFRLTEFVDEFNAHFDDIAAQHPVYGALQSVYTSAAVAELLRRSEAGSWLPGLLGPLLLDDPSMGQLATPRKVASIATLHRAVYRGKRHSIIVASGGVLVDVRQTVEPSFRSYDTLASLGGRFALPDQTRWWWNAQ